MSGSRANSLIAGDDWYGRKISGFPCITLIARGVRPDEAAIEGFAKRAGHAIEAGDWFCDPAVSVPTRSRAVQASPSYSTGLGR
jgi:hypothetical protein